MFVPSGFCLGRKDALLQGFFFTFTLLYRTCFSGTPSLPSRLWNLMGLSQTFNPQKAGVFRVG